MEGPRQMPTCRGLRVYVCLTVVPLVRLCVKWTILLRYVLVFLLLNCFFFSRRATVRFKVWAPVRVRDSWNGTQHADTIVPTPRVALRTTISLSSVVSPVCQRWRAPCTRVLWRFIQTRKCIRSSFLKFVLIITCSLLFSRGSMKLCQKDS